ncbi:MAG TPA: sugar ABC transporter ATP-binding protein [Pseudonocardiaceae bacterium]|nr:sugar ABC transporter ATP-binding protein [Pseudonocardiaceae bacterium]
MSKPIMHVSHLSKSFSGQTVLDDVEVALGAGEILGLVGQNGSGKSTVIKCLSGYHTPDPGWTLEIDGRTFTRGLHPGEGAELGISFVHQDLGVLGDLSVLENLLFNRFATDRRAYISWRRERARARELLRSFDLALDPRALLSSLRPVEQAQVAIIRALMQLRERGHGTGVLVLDEATTFLDRTGRDSLHALLRAIAATGAGILFVSHDVQEVLDLADRVTVLRDGRVVDSAPADTLSAEDVVGLIVGGDRSVRLEQLADDVEAEKIANEADGVGRVAAVVEVPHAAHRIGRLELVGLDSAAVDNVGFTAAAGDIIGITGIVGSGWEAVLEHVYGARQPDAGTLVVDDQRFDLARMSPSRAIAQGMVFVPSDRLAQGAIATLPVEQNVMLPVLPSLFRGGFLRHRELVRRCAGLLHNQAVQPADPHRPFGTLSGGNQQKAVLGKWLQLAPRLVLLNEPTQGVDVGARQLIFRIIRDAAASDAIVLYASADWDEIVRLADRVVVIADGAVTATLGGDDVTVDRIAAEAYRGTRRSADLAAASADWAVTQEGA